MKQFLVRILNFCIISILLFSTQTLAASEFFPNEPLTYANPNFTRPIPYDERIKMLKAIEKNAQNVVKVFTLDDYGTPQGNRSLYAATVGTGPLKIWIQTGIRGNESFSSEVILKMLNTLGNDSTKETQMILGQVTLYVVPIYNVDGYELNHTNTNAINEVSSIIKENLDLNDGLKIPLNDQTDTFITEGFMPYYQYWCALKPDFALDIRYQSIDDSNDLNDSPTFSMGIPLVPNGPVLSNLEEGYFNDVTRQIHGYVYHSLKDSGYDHITRYQLKEYPSDPYNNILSAMMLGMNHKNLNPNRYSCPAVFFETYGHAEKNNSIQPFDPNLTEQNLVALKAFLYGIVTGEVQHIDPKYWDEIPYHVPKI
ncbi:M14 family zinc carboxypeptidase [Clostridiaceae bacterium 35-E11]